MDGFALLLGHLCGDYILQNDWMASWKSRSVTNTGEATLLGDLVCTCHCVVYTLCVLAFSFWWMPWWGYLLCFLIHWPIDRYRLARWWMENISGQKAFATGPLSPWSIIVVDNTFHLLTLYGIWALTLVT